MESNEYYMKKMNGKETETLFNKFNNSYENIAEGIRIKGNCIYIQKNRGKCRMDNILVNEDQSSIRSKSPPQSSKLKNNHSLSVILETVG